MAWVRLNLVHAVRTPKRLVRGASAALLVAGVIAGGLGILRADPAGATDVNWVAYVGGGASSPVACPQTNTVANQCTLTQALSLAGNGDNVLLATAGSAGSYDGNFTIGTSITLRPAPSVLHPVLDGGGGTGPVLSIKPGVTATVDGVTVSGGTNATTDVGGGISNRGTLTLADATVSGNSLTPSGPDSGGGGIFNGGTITVDDSTISDNSVTSGSATTSGGGLLNVRGTATIADSTITGNAVSAVTEAGGGGLATAFGPLTIEDSTVVGNRASAATVAGGTLFAQSPAILALAGSIVAKSTGGADCFGTATDDGYNVADDGSCAFSATGSVNHSSSIDSYLGSLSNNGGPTETVPLLASPTSPVGPDPALDAIPSTFDQPSGPAACSVPDQRGVARSAPCDMGAYETRAAASGGATVFAASPESAPGTATVTPKPTTTSLTASDASAAVGETVTYTATVSPAPDAGSVSFSDNGMPAACEAGSTSLSSGVATCSVTYTAAGSHTVVATSSGDTTFGPSVSNPVGVGVAVTPTTTTLTASDTAPGVGGTVTYTAMVSPMPDDGTVTFSDNGSPITCGFGSISLTSGVAECNVTDSAAGLHTVVATYSGDSAFGPSVSNAG